MNYRQLDRESSQLANYLLRRGAGPEVSIGILMERSIEMIVVLLGVLKAGGVYVPLDPGFPAERLRLLLAAAQVKLLIAHSVFPSTLPVGSHASVVSVHPSP